MQDLNSLPNKFDQLKLITANLIDILIMTETKINFEFP